MKKINFTHHVLPYTLAIIAFLLVTISFFNPVFFEDKTLIQPDIQQSTAMSKALMDYRDQTGEEGLWAPNLFSGMPGYLVNVRWSYQVISVLKKVLSFNLPHPICNIFLAFLCYYIMLLTFKIRPYLAIAGALAFGLSSFMIIGLSAGHNGRIGAMAFIPLVMAGVHLAFSDKRTLGFGVTATGLALHLRENHIQVTYYLVFILLGYGLMQFIVALHENKVKEFLKTTALLIPAVALAIGSFFGPLWSVAEYSTYSTRGKSELVSTTKKMDSGLDSDYVFQFSYGIPEPLTLLVPNFYGGSSKDLLSHDKTSSVSKIIAQTKDKEEAKKLSENSKPYWGQQPLAAPYYAGSIIVFLFVLGTMLADRKITAWVISVSVLAILMSYGKNFQSFSDFMFEYFPGYNKFRSVTFAMIIVFFSMPLLSLLGLENLIEKGITTETRLKILLAFVLTGGTCLLLMFVPLSFLNGREGSLPKEFIEALQDDRKLLLQYDALRSFGFIAAFIVSLYFFLAKKLEADYFYVALILLVTADMTMVSNRYFNTGSYKSTDKALFIANAAEQQVLKDSSYYRAFSLDPSGRDSYFFNSIFGYHGAPLKRYQNFLDSCLYDNFELQWSDHEKNQLDFSKYGMVHLLNCKYIIYGEKENDFIENKEVYGPAWFVKQVITAHSPNEELATLKTIDPRTTAVLDISKFKKPDFQFDSLSTIKVIDHQPNYLQYEADAKAKSLLVFSEIYYPEGWTASIDGKETPTLRVDYILRALEISEGKHQIEFRFAPKSYTMGNPITMASSWMLLLVLLGSLGWSLKKADA